MIDANDMIEEYLSNAWWVRENANTSFSYQDLRRQLASEAIKYFWLTKVYTKPIKDAYTDGFFHIHDLGHYSVYCVGWSLEDLLLRGFSGGAGKQKSKPPKHLSTALGHSVNDLFTKQNEAAGAQALNHFDTFLAPFIHYDKLTQREVDQIIQKFIFDMNVTTRNGNQAPFTNVTLDQTVPKYLEDEPVIIGGKYTGDTFGSFQEEMDMFNRAWWKQRLAGDGEGRPQPFPIETLNITDTFNWDDELLFKAVAMTGAPYFSNFVNTGRDASTIRSMCCRLELPLLELAERNGGFFGSGDKTGSIGVVTMNLPLIGYLSKNEDEFFDILSEKMDIGKNSLEMKRKEIERLMDSGFYPVSKIALGDTKERHGEWWKNHFSTIGLVGMNEAILNLFGHGIVTKEGLDFAVKTLHFIRNKLLEYQKETGNLYNGEATPAEFTAHKLARRDKINYSKIITMGNAPGFYYTNSTNVPVDTDMPLMNYVSHQNHLLPLYTGGSVFHIWNGEKTPHWEGVMKIVQRFAHYSKIPYYTYTPTTSVCLTHGRMSGEWWNCPQCGAKTEVWSRITGYFSEVSRWNDGKQHEFKDRVHFNL